MMESAAMQTLGFDAKPKHVSELTLLVGGETDTSFRICLEKGGPAELTLLHPVNTAFDEMVITYDLQIRGSALDLSITLYEF